MGAQTRVLWNGKGPGLGAPGCHVRPRGTPLLSQAKVVVDFTPPQQPAPSLGTAAGRGFAWMLGQTLLSKVLSIGAQSVLAGYLVRADMGLVALALAVASFPCLLRD